MTSKRTYIILALSPILLGVWSKVQHGAGEAFKGAYVLGEPLVVATESFEKIQVDMPSLAVSQYLPWSMTAYF